ncbi:MAG: hypothetical protein WKF37_13115 [Bryobacteraceae bacterium]
MQRLIESPVLDAKIDRVAAVLDAKIDRVAAGLDAKIVHVETTLLTEFHKWASPLEARIRTHTATLRALDAENEAIDDRIKKLENSRGMQS